jgi:TRAP-type mannitol/chloroaromatic compound transport system permease large subunit
MNINKFFEIIKISLQSTIWAGGCLILVGGIHAYAEHSLTFLIIYFSAIFIFNYPISWVLVHYIVFPIMEKYKQEQKRQL